MKSQNDFLFSVIFFADNEDLKHAFFDWKFETIQQKCSMTVVTGWKVKMIFCFQWCSSRTMKTLNTYFSTEKFETIRQKCSMTVVSGWNVNMIFCFQWCSSRTLKTLNTHFSTENSRPYSRSVPWLWCRDEKSKWFSVSVIFFADNEDLKHAFFDWKFETIQQKCFMTVVSGWKVKMIFCFQWYSSRTMKTLNTHFSTENSRPYSRSVPWLWWRDEKSKWFSVFSGVLRGLWRP